MSPVPELSSNFEFTGKFSPLGAAPPHLQRTYQLYITDVGKCIEVFTTTFHSNTSTDVEFLQSFSL